MSTETNGKYAIEARDLRVHYGDFTAGLISTEHIVYYISWIAASLFLATQALQARRWR